MIMDRNIKLTIAYDGTDFCGWQRQAGRLQSNLPCEKTVQGARWKNCTVIL